MAKYSVLIPCTCSILFEIDAESAEDAKQSALDSEFHLEVSGPGDLCEFEVHEHVCKGNVFYGVLNSIEVHLIDD